MSAVSDTCTLVLAGVFHSDFDFQKDDGKQRKESGHHLDKEPFQRQQQQKKESQPVVIKKR